MFDKYKRLVSVLLAFVIFFSLTPTARMEEKLSILSVFGNDELDITKPIRLIATLPGGEYSRFSLKLGDVSLITNIEKSQFRKNAYVITGYYPESYAPTLGKTTLTLSSGAEKITKDVSVIKLYQNIRKVDFTGLSGKSNSELTALVNSYFSLNGTKVANDTDNSEAYILENKETDFSESTFSLYVHNTNKDYSYPVDGNSPNPIEVAVSFAAKFLGEGDGLSLAVYPKNCGGNAVGFNSPINSSFANNIVIVQKNGKFADGTAIEYGRKYQFEIKLNRAFNYYEVYADGEKLFDGDISFDAAIASGAKKDINAISFNASARQRVLLDDICIRARTGNTNPAISDTSVKPYLYYAFDKKNDLIFEPNGGSVAILPEEGNTANNVLAISRTEGTQKPQCCIVLPNTMDKVTNYTAEFDLKLLDNTGIISLIGILGDDGNYTSGFSATAKSLYANGKKIQSLQTGKWYNIAFCFDYLSKTTDVYIDGKLCGDDIKYPGSAMANPDMFITGISSETSGKASYYIDNLHMYPGSVPVDFTDEELSEAAIFDTILESEEDATNLIGTASIFMTNTDNYYTNGTKLSYSASGIVPITSGDKFMLPKSLAEQSFDVSIDLNSGKLTIDGTKADSVAHITENGTLYVSIEDMAEAVDGMYLYNDDRGFYMLDNKPIAYTNSEIPTIITEPIDTIYRYMFFERPSSDDILSAFKQKATAHPRLITTEEDIKEIKSLVASNGVMKNALSNTETKANKYINTAQVTQKFDSSGSFLSSARSSMSRIRCLGIAYAITGNTDYADQAWASMENAINWSTWNEYSYNYLDTAETAYGVILGYDLIYDYLTEAQKQKVEDAIFERFLDTTTCAYKGRHRRTHWVTGNLTNWSFVCNGSAMACSLALADRVTGERLDTIKFIISNAPQSIEHALMGFYPNGAWPEGAGYWQYSVMYLYGAMLSPLINSCGTTFGLDKAEGLDDTLKYTIATQGPSGHGFNFGDTFASFVERDGTGYLIALTKQNADEMAKWHYTAVNNGNNGDEKTLLWYRPWDSSTNEMPLDNYFKGSDVGIMRASYSDNQKAYVGVKGGYTDGGGHSNLDAGNFIFDNMGVRWAEEMGFDDYNIASVNYWTEHHKLYRVRPEGQNVIVINPRADDDSKQYWGGQLNHKYAPLVQSSSTEDTAQMTFDLGAVYAEDTNYYTRSFTLGDGRTSLTVKDEIELKSPNSDIYWFMHTKATDISISEDGKTAILTRSGKKLKLTALSDADSYSFEIREVKPFDSSPQIPDQLQGEYAPVGVRKLTLKLKGSGKVDIEVQMTPLT